MRAGLHALLLLLLLARPAAADGECRVPRNEAGLSFAENVELASRCYKAGQYEPAIAALLRAYAQEPETRLLYNLARAYHKAGQELEALVMYERFLQAEPRSPRRGEIMAYLLDVRTRVKSGVPATEPPPAGHAAPALHRGASPPAPPFYKQWWFWTAVGGALVVGVTVGALAGALAPRGEPEYTNQVTLSFP
jgi:tetratricopeptide (TPR) repeat protein